LFSLNSGEAKSQRAWRASFAAVLLRPLASETQASSHAAGFAPQLHCLSDAVRCHDATPSSNAKRHKPSRGGVTPSAAQTAWLRKRSWHVRRRCFPSLRSAGILVAFISGEASCITRLSRRTPNGVRALHALHSLGAAHIYVMPQAAECVFVLLRASMACALSFFFAPGRPMESALFFQRP
jgi:hypothetical protein